jgi:hypothetical protein
MYPTTAAGRGVAVVLMLVGVGLFGLLAGSLASFLIERGRSDEVRGLMTSGWRTSRRGWNASSVDLRRLIDLMIVSSEPA